MIRSPILGLALAGGLVLTGCASRPTQAELTTAILEAIAAEPDVELTEDQAACIADHLLASELSDTTLSGLAEDFDNPEVLETELNDVEPLVTEATLRCP